MTKSIEQDIALKDVFTRIEKMYGKGSIFSLEQHDVAESVPVISTGSYVLNGATGIGGVPLGRIVEIFGPESSGKTTVALKIMAQCQKQGGRVAFIDVEHALDLKYLQSLGGQLNDSLVILQPNSAEEALQTAYLLTASGAFSLVIIDSVAALVPQSEIDGNIGDHSIGVQSRLMSQALRKITPVAQNKNVCVIFINQIRMKIGTMYGNPETTSGGVALKFYSSIRIEVRRGNYIHGENDDIIGHEMKCKIVKNKLSAPHRTANISLLYCNQDEVADLVQFSIMKNVISRAGSWYSYGEHKLGQGLDKVVQHIRDNPDLKQEIIQKVTNIK